MPTPKATFVAYQLSIRRAPGTNHDNNANKRAVQALWRGKTPAEKTTIAARISEALAAEEEVEAQTILDAIANANFLALNVPGPALIERLESEEWHRSYQSAHEAKEKLRDLNNGRTFAWVRLRAEEIRQGNNVIGRDHANAQVTAARTLGGNVGTDLDTIEQIWYQPPIPLDPTNLNAPKIATTWIPEYADRRKRQRIEDVANAVAATGAVAKPPGSGRWVGWHVLGDDSDGQVWLYILDDQNGNVTNRTVEKNVDFSEHWYDVRAFAPRPPAQTPAHTRTPWELQVNHRMRSAPHGKKHVVRMDRPATSDRIPGYIDVPNQMYWLYLDWHNRGDLKRFIAHYRAAGPASFIPEPMIWAAAEQLARAGLAMQRGSGSTKTNGPENWKSVVHRDLRPANIFLTDPEPNDTYQSYLRLDVGDFGMAFRIEAANNAHNPDFWVGTGTKGYLAPEQIRYANRDNLVPLNDWNIGEKTNVFQIGVILYCMVTLTTDPQQPYWLGNGSTDTTYSFGGPGAWKRNAWRYSGELRAIINGCTAFLPGNRFTCKELLDEIWKNVEHDDDSVSEPSDYDSDDDDRPDQSRGLRRTNDGVSRAAHSLTYRCPEPWYDGLAYDVLRLAEDAPAWA